MEFKIDDLSDDRVIAFLDEHISDMKSISPPESKHALDVAGLKKPDVTFWTVWEGDELIGCGALKELDPAHAEVKSMRVSAKHRRRGVASKLLAYLIGEAKQRKYRQLSLETGSMPFFEPARKLYEKFKFQYVPPFATYKEDPNSAFMSLNLEPDD